MPIKDSTLLEVQPSDASVYSYFPCCVSLSINCISIQPSIFLFRLVLYFLQFSLIVYLYSLRLVLHSMCMTCTEMTTKLNQCYYY